LLGVDAHDVARLAQRDAQIAALPDRKAVHSRMLAHGFARFVDDRPRP